MMAFRQDPLMSIVNSVTLNKNPNKNPNQYLLILQLLANRPIKANVNMPVISSIIKGTK